MTYEEWVDWTERNPRAKVHRDQVWYMAEKTIEHLHDELGRALVECDRLRQELKVFRGVEHAPASQERQAKLIVHAVANCVGVSLEELHSARRTTRIAHARHAAWWLIRQRTALCLSDIGRTLGGFNHSTVLYGINAVEQERYAGEGHRWATVQAVLAQQTEAA